MKMYLFLSIMMLFSNFIFAQEVLLDSSFGTDGFITTEISNLQEGDGSCCVEIQPDGKILVAGTTNIFFKPDFAVVRYNTDGSLDSTFDSDGIVVTDIKSGSDDYTYSMVLQSDGKIILAGSSYLFLSNIKSIALARYNPNGSLDSTFDSDGIVVTDVDSWAIAKTILLQPDNKIIVSGNSKGVNATRSTLVRYNTDGSLDFSFALGGIAYAQFDSSIYMESKSAILQSDGKIIVVGITQNTAISNLFDLFLLRFNNNGSLDSSFGLDGSVEADIDSTSDVAYDIAIQSDEKILITGNTTIEPSSTAGSDIFVMRYNNDGSVDNSFASSGISIIDFNSNNDYAHSIILQADGQILVAGNTDDTTQKVLLLRLTSLGWVDSTFSEDGIATTYVNNTLQSDAFAGNFASSAILQSDGKIVIAGTAQISFYDYAFLVERLFLDSKVGIIDLQASEIASYVLYPNPLSNHCYFSYEITQPEHVNLQLTDLAGQTMRIFFNEKKTDGKHTEQLSLDGISSGVYLLQLSTDKEIVSVKIVKQ